MIDPPESLKGLERHRPALKLGGGGNGVLGNPHRAVLEPHPEGNWVRLSDVAALLAEQEPEKSLRQALSDGDIEAVRAHNAKRRESAPDTPQVSDEGMERAIQAATEVLYNHPLHREYSVEGPAWLGDPDADEWAVMASEVVDAAIPHLLQRWGDVVRDLRADAKAANEAADAIERDSGKDKGYGVKVGEARAFEIAARLLSTQQSVQQGQEGRLREALERLQNGPDTLTPDGLRIVIDALYPQDSEERCER